MHVVLAAEGGYQTFELGGGEIAWLWFAAATAVAAIAVGFALMRTVCGPTPARHGWARSPRRSRRAPWPTCGASSGPSG